MPPGTSDKRGYAAGPVCAWVIYRLKTSLNFRASCLECLAWLVAVLYVCENRFLSECGRLPMAAECVYIVYPQKSEKGGGIPSNVHFR